MGLGPADSHGLPLPGPCGSSCPVCLPPRASPRTFSSLVWKPAEVGVCCLWPEARCSPCMSQGLAPVDHKQLRLMLSRSSSSAGESASGPKWNSPPKRGLLLAALESTAQVFSCHPLSRAGTQALWASQGTAGPPHLAVHGPSESRRNNVSLPPPTSRAKCPHKKGLGGQAPAFVI